MEVTENPRSGEIDELDEITAIPRWDSMESNLSFISASQSLDDTFQAKFAQESLEHVKTQLKNLLSNYANLNSSTGIENVSGLVSMLGECLEEFKQQADYWKQSYEQKDKEQTEMKTLYDEKVSNLFEENQIRISNIISSNEKQLSTAVERAVNARRQAEILQIQLNESRSKIASLEQKCNENYLNSLSFNHSHFQHSSDEMNELLKKLNELEIEKDAWRKDKESLTEEKDTLADKLNKQMKFQAELLKETEESVEIYKTQLQEKDDELLKERTLNQNLWASNNNSAQEIAVLKVKLDVATKELEYRNKMFSILKQEHSEQIEKQNISQNSSITLKNEIESNSERVEDLVNILKEKKKLASKLEVELHQVETDLKKKSVQIQMNSDRAASFNQRLKHLEEQILHTSTTVESKEVDLKNLEDKLKARESKLNKLARKAYQERVKASELDTSLKMSIVKERTLSEKLRNLKREETSLENDITLHQSRSESLLKVLQSRQNLINQLEREDEKSEARITELFDKNLPLPIENTFDVVDYFSKERNSRDVSVISENNLSSITGRISFESEIYGDHNHHSSSNYDNLDMSLTQTLPVEIINNCSNHEGINMECTLGQQKAAQIETKLPSDTDSGISFVTEGFKGLSTLQDPAKHLQSTPVKNEHPKIKEDTPKLTEKCDNHGISRPSVSINIFQATGRVRHNSLPSAAGKNRLRYKTNLQDCLPNYSTTLEQTTHEQSSQTSTSSYLESSRNSRRKDFVERQPADGVEPITPK